MLYQTALKKLDGQSCGGQLIMILDGRHVLVGKHHDGQLLVEDNDEARALVAGLNDDPLDHDSDGKKGGKRGKRGAIEAPTPADEPEPEPAPIHHSVVVDDEVITADALANAG